jgi:hypothetical protein
VLDVGICRNVEPMLRRYNESTAEECENEGKVPLQSQYAELAPSDQSQRRSQVVTTNPSYPLINDCTDVQPHLLHIQCTSTLHPVPAIYIHMLSLPLSSISRQHATGLSHSDLPFLLFDFCDPNKVLSPPFRLDPDA